ncbi:MAG: precorrin-6y C5,15-methyltransferase (decarboxylating) subunit CbiE, partial [Lachnospiraceae bacterium]|nr:precorrin-6y C5,15-methyltransferase (decarboxylating) subunit CbiE [Lachnospiraceae bacterium]
CQYLNGLEGNILLTTGSKELADYAGLISDVTRLYPRFLPDADSVEKAKSLGIKPAQIICMQGPFSADINAALLKQFDCKYLVTKDTGSTGGFPEKIAGAALVGAEVIVIERPQEQVEGLSVAEVCGKLGIPAPEGKSDKGCCCGDRFVTILGIGMGNPETLTMEGFHACESADVIIGAGRMLEGLQRFNKPVEDLYRAEDIINYINEHKEFKNIIVAFSGDIGFYSGATKLNASLAELGVKVKRIPGISSVVYFASKLGMPWQDVKLVSLHGRNQNIIDAIRHNRKVFALVGKAESVRDLSEILMVYKYDFIRMHVGFMLSYPEEKILSGKPADFKDFDEDGLSVVILENDDAGNAAVTHGLPDSAFSRGEAPMTKEEIRSISISKLELTRDGVLYDVGAGTGSISVECALQMADGEVYAIEKKEEAVELLKKNKLLHGAYNLEIVEGLAPEALEDLPDPTHAFIGGSSGNMKEIVELLLRKNPKVRIVINAIAMETIAETTQLIQDLQFTYVDIVNVAVGKSKKLGRYNMMMGQNPVVIFTVQNT